MNFILKSIHIASMLELCSYRLVLSLFIYTLPLTILVLIKYVPFGRLH